MTPKCSADSECSTGSCTWEDICGPKVERLKNCNSNADCQTGLYYYQPDPSDDGGYCEDV
jgi:hypothetical protein